MYLYLLKIEFAVLEDGYVTIYVYKNIAFFLIYL